MKLTKGAIGAGVAAVAVLGLGGVAFAEGGAPAPAAPNGDAAQQQVAQKQVAQHHGKHHGKKHHPLAGLEHGEFTKTTKQGDRVVDIQRGDVVAVNPTTLTVRSKDGFTATYAVDQTTKVHKQHKNAPFTEVKPGDHVGVRAAKEGPRAVAHQVHDAGVPKPKK